MENNNYLELITPGAIQNGTFNNAEVQEILGSLWLLLGQRTERLTMGDSSSVPIETAEALLRSICFSIGLHLQDMGDFSALKTKELDRLLKSSWIKLEDKIAEGKRLLQQVTVTAPAIENRSYADTLQGIAMFFKHYDYRFFAHDIPGNIDYQLCHPVSEELLGIVYINDYLRRLNLENSFCQYFTTESMIDLLQSYCPDYKELLINIFDAVATNALGLALLDKAVIDLDISDLDREVLSEYFGSWTKDEAFDALTLAVWELKCQLNIEDEGLIDYLKQTAKALQARIGEKADNLSSIFLSLPPKQGIPMQSTQYIDGDMMEDEKLRDLIDQINECDLVPDKVELVIQEVRSLRDLVEILNICFWGDDSEQLFAQWGDAEFGLLRTYLKGRPENWQSDTGWEKYLPH